MTQRVFGRGMLRLPMRLGLGIALLAAALSCARSEKPGEPAPAALPANVPVRSEPEAKPADECAARIEAVRALPGLPGAPAFEQNRAHLLARSTGEPVLFVRPPRDVPELAQAGHFRRVLERGPSPYFSLQRIYTDLRAWPELARQVLLRDGYLYAEEPALAAALVYFVQLPHLFREDTVFIQRGDRVLETKRTSRYRYEYVDGPDAGKTARVMFADRFSLTRDGFGEPLHRDLKAVAREMASTRMHVRHITTDAIVADFQYGEARVPTLLSTDGARVRFECEVAPADDGEVAFARDLAVRRRPILDALRASIVSQVEEALPFDEPITEEGQQDGNLRPAWIWAYNHGWYSYEFNDDRYSVFDLQGRPKIPQVCIDFITDTFERASGTWWKHKEEERQRVPGGVDFDQLDIVNRRSVDVFLSFAWDHPEWFDTYRLQDEERIPFRRRGDFFDHLAEHRERYQPGDVIAIHGLKSDGEVHYHSFFVFEADPITGMPILLAGNAGKPRIRSWEAVMRSAPRRSIKAVVRPRLEWLERIVPVEQRVTQTASFDPSSPI